MSKLKSLTFQVQGLWVWSRIKKMKLNEKLVVAELDRLKMEMKADPELKDFLNTPFGDLPENYLEYFLPEMKSYFARYTLLDILKMLISEDNTESIFYFSETDSSKLEGVVNVEFDPYDEDVVTNISVISFHSDRNSYTITKDIMWLVDSLRRSYKEVNFLSTTTNPIVDKYKLMTRKFGGNWKLSNTYRDVYIFTIPGYSG